MVAIVTDDNAGFTQAEAERLGIYVVPMPVIIDGQEHFENRDLTAKDFYKIQAAGADIHTSQPTPGSVMDIWRTALSRADSVVHIPMSSGLTQSVQTAKMLSHEDEFEGRVFVADNHRISVTLRDAVYDAIYLARKGYSAKDIRDHLEATSARSKIYIYVDTLEYLKKGGRVTPAAAAMGSVLHIKPVLKIEGGKLDAKAKAIGARKAQQCLIDFVKEDLATIFKDTEKPLTFAMAYTPDLDSDDTKARDFRLRFAAELGVSPQSILMDPLSLSVAVHIGPGALATTVTEVEDADEILDAAEREFDLHK